MAFGDQDDGDVTVGGFVDVVGRAIVVGEGVAGAGRNGAAGAVVLIQHRGEAGIDRFDHRDLHQPANAGTGLFQQAGHQRAVEMRPAEDVHVRRARPQRRSVSVTGGAHDAGSRLHGEVHRQIVAIRTREAETGRGSIDHARIDFVQHREPDAQPVHHAGRVILHQCVGFQHQLAQDFLAFVGLQVQRDAALVGVQHRHRHGCFLAGRGHQPQAFAAGRLDFDHIGAGLGEHEGGVRSLVELGEIEDCVSG